MRTLTLNMFNALLEMSDMRPRAKNELKFISSTVHYPDDWADTELLAIRDRTEAKGVLLLQPGDDLYIVPFELSRRIVDAGTGRERAVICDLCYTWQPGSNAASITFVHATTKHTITILCCADLQCSQNVRTLTQASITSRAQLRENITNEDRIHRLKKKLGQRLQQIGSLPTTLNDL